MKSFTLLLVAIITSRLCVAADLSVPTHQFLKDLFKNPEAMVDFREMWTGTPNATAARDDPNGGYLFRFTLQFEGSDDVLVFIASDRFGDLPRSTPAWSVYQGTVENSWKWLSGGELIQTGGFLVHHSSRTLIKEFPDRFGEGKTYEILRFVKSGAIVKESYHSEGIPSEVMKMIEEDSVFEDFEVEKIPLISYMRSPLAEWRPLSEHGMESQSLDPGDVRYLALIADIPWTEAVKIFDEFDKLAAKAELQNQEFKMDSGEGSPRNGVASEIPQKKIGKNLLERSSSASLVATLALVLLGGSLAWLRIKKRI